MDDLAPLPSTFDGDMSPPHSPEADLSLTLESGMPLFDRDVQTASPPEYDDLESRSGTPPAVQAEIDQAQAPDHLQDHPMVNMEVVYDEGEGGEIVEEAMDAMEEDEGDRPAPETELWGFLAQLQGTKEDGYNEDEEEEEEEEPVEDKEEREAALSSPLSDLPELPNVLPNSPETPSPKLRTALPDTLDDIPSIDSVFAPIGPAARGPMPGARSAIKGVKRARTESTDTTKPAAPRATGPPTISTLASYSNGHTTAPPFSRPHPHAHSHDPRSARSSVTPAPSEVDNRMGNTGNKKRKVAGKPNGAGKDAKGAVEIRPGREFISSLMRSPAQLTAGLYNDAQIRDYLLGKDREVQMAACLRPRYHNWGKCTQCVSKVGGDSCRFRDYRVFKIDPATADIIAPGWFESTELKEDMTTLPKIFNAPFTEVHMKKIEQTVAPMLLPLITRELRHVVRNDAIKRGTDAAKHRAVCDFCSSTIFGGWFFCKKCGRDYCLVCERYFADSAANMIESPWHLPDAARPRLLRCNATTNPDDAKEAGAKPSRGKAFHFRPDLQPVSRFSEDELREHWLSLTDFVLHSKDGVGERLKVLGLKDADEETVESMQSWLARLEHPPPAAAPPMTDEQVSKLYTKRTHPTAKPISDPSGLDAKNREFLFIENKELSHEVFDQLWSKGEPIVVDKVGDGLKMRWTPDEFIERFGHEQCVVVDCQKNTPEAHTVEKFFTKFKDPEQRSDKILKLKDWPQTNDFADTHPALYNDFCDALPVPDYTRREGVMNLYAHFPPGPTRPDIGPKMYNAFAAQESIGGQGSTRLHMDVADAVNVMLYASSRADGEPGCAVWDLFRAEDADKIRSYLRHKFDKSHKFTDPIHSQLFYLDSAKRKELSDKHGVVSWRVYQYPGQAVFIPAGCAHQVCNLADCIKIALDFVSTHNVSRCQQLTQDFRTENFVKVWKEDVLQLYNVLWYAWSNVAETRQHRLAEVAKQEEEVRARKAHLDSLANGQHDLPPTSTPFGSSTPYASVFGERHRHTGMLVAAMSSVRDEENTRSPSAASSPTRNEHFMSMSDRSDRGRDANARETDAMDLDTASVDGDREKGPDNDVQVKDEPDTDPSRAEETREYALELLEAMLLTSEPPPPPEARAPSAATKWGGAAMRAPLSARAGAGLIPGLSPRLGSPGPALLPRTKRLSAAGSRTRTRAESEKDKAQGKDGSGPKDKEGEKEGEPAKLLPRRTKTSDLIKRGAMPIDIAVSAARLQMGQGADEDEERDVEGGDGARAILGGFRGVDSIARDVFLRGDGGEADAPGREKSKEKDAAGHTPAVGAPAPKAADEGLSGDGGRKEGSKQQGSVLNLAGVGNGQSGAGAEVSPSNHDDDHSGADSRGAQDHTVATQSNQVEVVVASTQVPSNADERSDPAHSGVVTDDEKAGSTGSHFKATTNGRDNAEDNGAAPPASAQDKAIPQAVTASEQPPVADDDTEALSDGERRVAGVQAPSSSCEVAVLPGAATSTARVDAEPASASDAIGAGSNIAVSVPAADADPLPLVAATATENLSQVASEAMNLD